jgi:hypothetical protein
VELRDGGLRIGVTSHRDERKTARFAGEFVLDEQHFGDRAGLREEILQIGLGRVEREVAHVEFVTHVIFCSVGLSAVFGDGSRSSVSSRH